MHRISTTSRARRALLLCGLSALLAALPAAPAPAATVQRDVPIGTAPNGTVLSADVYRSTVTPPKNAPVVLYAHGGGFTSGERRQMGTYAASMTERGFLALTVGYRLTTTTQLAADGYELHARAAQHDLQAAIRWVRGNAAELGGQPNHIFIAGYSAGAIAALRAAYLPEDPGASGTPGVPSSVAGVISMSGAACFTDAASLTSRFAGCTPPFDPSDPPALFQHGTVDPTIQRAWAQSSCTQAATEGGGCAIQLWGPFASWWSSYGGDHGMPLARTSELINAQVTWMRNRILQVEPVEMPDPVDREGPPVGTGIAIGTGSDGTTLRADIERTSAVPNAGATAIVIPRDGTLTAGDRAGMVKYASAMGSRGFLTAVVDMHTTTDAALAADGWEPHLQAAQDDVARAVAFIREHAADLGVDPDRIFVAGNGIGGQVASRVATRPSPRIVAGALIVATADCHPGSQDRGARFAGCTPAFDAADAPLHMSHGTADSVTQIDLARGTCTAAQEAGMSCTLRTYSPTYWWSSSGGNHAILWSRLRDIADQQASWIRAR